MSGGDSGGVNGDAELSRRSRGDVDTGGGGSEIELHATVCVRHGGGCFCRAVATIARRG